MLEAMRLGDGKIKLSRSFISVESVGTVNIVVEEQLCKCFKSSAGSQSSEGNEKNHRAGKSAGW
jgi:hypothetical protein